MKKRGERQHPHQWWTEDEIEQLREWSAEGLTSKEIGKRLNRSVPAITASCLRHGIQKSSKFPKRDPKILAQVIKFRMCGWRMVDIAFVFGTNLSQVCRLLRINGFRGRWHVAPKKCEKYRRWSEVELARLRKCLKREYPLKQIQAEFPHRAEKGVEKQIKRMTRFWFTPEEQAERQALREKYLQWRVY